MTGYGESLNATYGKLSLSLSSVNHRSLCIDCKLPQGLEGFQEMLRCAIKKKIDRGRISLSLTWNRPADGEDEITLNTRLAEKLKPLLQDLPIEVWSGAAVHLGLVEKSERAINKPALEKSLAAALDEALESLITSKLREGAELQEAIERHFSAIEKLVKSIDIPTEKKYLEETKRAKLEPLELSDERLYAEVALLIDKSDVTEEIDRINAHLKSVKSIFLSPCFSKGKKLDFLLQELAREAATLTCKVTQIPSKAIAIEIRSEIEKIREQVANVE